MLKLFAPNRTLTLWEHHSNKVLTGRLCVIPRNWDSQKAVSGIFYTWICTSIHTKFKSFRNSTQELKLRIQEEISRIPVDVLHRAMSSVHNRLAECEQHNGGHLEDVIFRVEWCVMFFYAQCYVSRPLIHLFLQMLKYVFYYKCNCIMISNTFNVLLTLKNRPIHWQTLYLCICYFKCMFHSLVIVSHFKFCTHL